MPAPRVLDNALVPPMGKTSVKLPADAGTKHYLPDPLTTTVR
ncbi:Chaperone protein fimC precursor [Cedecea neteri]|uniref:Chaperone protein fimC n=1 Tax=Cedecea neteri TaxID=158822 RepID=A0A2X2SVI0_9ENTR|nr:Chaperone protein fimC precursor [Cedecea neteri]